MRPALPSLALLFFQLVPSVAAGEFFRVGAGGPAAGCTHDTIQGAVFAAGATPGPHFIQVASNQSYTDQSIEIFSFTGAEIELYILGGYTDCQEDFLQATAPPLSIDGTGSAPVFRVGTANVLIGNFDIHGSGVYGVFADGMSNLYLESVWVRNNSGGVNVSGATAFLADALIYSNLVAGEGGGVRCLNGTLTLQDVEIFGNTANHGGGIALRSGCNATFTNDVVIRDNVAVFDGGGIDLSSSSATDIGRGSDPVTGSTLISGNQAVRDGGGLALDDATWNVGNTRIVGNTAQNYGGGAYLDAASTLRLSRGGSCKTRPCTEVSENLLTTEVLGSGIHARGGSLVQVHSAALHQNDNDSGSAYPVYLTDSTGHFESVAAWGNQGTGALPDRHLRPHSGVRLGGAQLHQQRRGCTDRRSGRLDGRGLLQCAPGFCWLQCVDQRHDQRRLHHVEQPERHQRQRFDRRRSRVHRCLQRRSAAAPDIARGRLL